MQIMMITGVSGVGNVTIVAQDEHTAPDFAARRVPRCKDGKGLSVLHLYKWRTLLILESSSSFRCSLRCDSESKHKRREELPGVG